MILPARLRPLRGLERLGALEWRATDEDPQFLINLRGLLRPPHLVLVVDTLGGLVETAVYLDTGSGFSEAQSVAFRPSGRLICRLSLGRMPELRRIRLDPSLGPERVRVVAFGSWSSVLAGAVVRKLNRDRPGRGLTRVQTITTTGLETEHAQSGREARRYRETAEHYADVVAMAPATRILDHGSPEPLLSLLVPTYQTEPAHLDDLLASFRAQPTGVAELILSDDGSSSTQTLAWLEAHRHAPGVKVLRADANAGIAAATNRALEAASASWVALVDHDDALSPGSIAQLAGAISSRPEASFFYTDEAVTDPNLRPVGYLLKPAYDPVLLSGVNYINHLSVYRRDRVRALGGLRDGFQGSQDYDLLLRYLEGLRPEEVVHVPYPAYLWRRHAVSFSTSAKAVALDGARRTLAEHHAREGRPAEVEPALLPDLHRVRLDRQVEHWPRVSVVIPNRDSPALMRTVLGGLERTDYPSLEIIVADNDSADPGTLALYATETAGRRPFRVVRVPGPFNFSRSVNTGLKEASGDFLLLLNNDIEITDAGWLKEMVSCFRYPGTGIVGARLLYPDGTLQHAGVIVGLGGLAGHWHGGKPPTNWGPMGRLAVRQSFSAVTGAAMLISRACLEATGPFDEAEFAIAYNDVDFCLRARLRGFRTVWTPFATLVHHESATRGSDVAPDKIERFRREQNNLRLRHGTVSYSDPAYNPWYDLKGSSPGLRALDALPEPR
jgi:GT2 family glycosyltransferase